MIKFKYPDSGEIEAVKFILRSYPNKADFIAKQCEKYELTKEFMLEFGNYVSKEAFSKSPNLKYEVIKMYPDKFDFALWSVSLTKSLEPLINESFVENLTSSDINLVIKNSDTDNLTEEIYNRYQLLLEEDVKKVFINSTVLTNNEGFLLKNLASLDSSMFQNKKLTLNFSNTLIENILKNKKLMNLSFVVELLSRSNDIAFIKRMLETDFDYQSSGETNDYVMLNFLGKLPDMYMGVLFERVLKNSRNLFSYEVLEHLLKTKDNLSEEFLLEYIDLFKSNGMAPELAKYAREKEYQSVLINLKLSN